MTDSLRMAVHNAGAQASLDRIADTLAGLSPVQAARINPYQFAEQAGIAPSTAVDVFVHGAKLGVFDLEWGSVCPMCGAIMQASEALHHIAEQSIFCNFCRTDVDSVLDDTVEVTFALAAAPPLDDHADFAVHQALHTSSAYPYRAQWLRYHQDHTIGDVKLGPGERGTLDVHLNGGESYRLVCFDTHAGAALRAGTGEVRSFVLEDGDLTPGDAAVPAGQVALTLENRTENAVWLRLVESDMADVRKIMVHGRPQFSDRLTGSRLINNQAFRDCFSMRELAPDLKLKLRSLTLLFTDLKGSTALYDREGDLAAYRLVQEHFAALKGVVRAHSGAMIKTMGDAIMAAFPDGPSGAAAAIQMMREMQQITGGRTDDVGLKVGLHSGPALAINAGGNVDYFGQTVNIAARVQGLADSGDICLTRALIDDAVVADLLESAGYDGQAEAARLKGVSNAEQIMRYRIA